MAPFPETGSSARDVIAEVEDIASRDADWRHARLFGLVYKCDDDVDALTEAVYRRFIQHNALSVTAFPSLRRFEGDLLAWTAELLHAPAGAAGAMTTGGTESILMAVKVAREWGRARHGEHADLEIVVPATAHPAFHKAVHLLGMRAVVTPVRDDWRADVDAMRDAITERTVLLVGSAPGFPQGVVDPIEEIAALASERGILCHVDACLGGFMLPFVERLGNPVPPFDFRVEGVTSISADIHKYGYAPKGVSTVTYRDRALRRLQFFAYADWPGGLYGSPAGAGAKSGAPLAAAWAIMRYLGEEGYLERAARAMETTRRFTEAIEATPGLRLVAQPDMTVFSFTSTADGPDIFLVGDALEKRGWYLDRQQKPSALHAMISPGHAQVADTFLADFAEAVDEARAQGKPRTGVAAMYGALANLPDRGVVENFILDFLDNPPSP